MAYGSSIVIPVPGAKRVYPARYAVRELGSVHPSHDAVSFGRNPHYEHRNDRDYSRAGQAERLLGQASIFDAAYLVNTNPDAVNGPPIVDGRGNVLGGNGRVMLLRRIGVLQRTAYRDRLLTTAALFGLKPALVAKLAVPVLVRELIACADPQTAITDFNQTGTAALTPAERALADGRRVSADALEAVVVELAKEGDDVTLARVLAGPRGPRLLGLLVEDGVIARQEKAGYLDERGLVTPEGQRRLVRLVVGRLFEEPQDFELAPLDLRAKLERIVGLLARVEDRPAWSLTALTREAVRALTEARVRHLRDVCQLLDQAALFGDGLSYSEQAVRLARKLQETPLRAAAAFAQYARESGLSQHPTLLFVAAPSPEEAFAAAFGPALDGEKKEKKSPKAHNLLELNPLMLDNKDRKEKNQMTTITFTRTGDIKKSAEFQAPGYRVAFSRLAWLAEEGAEQLAAADSSAGLNAALAARGMRLRFVGSPKAGERTLVLTREEATGPEPEQPAAPAAEVVRCAHCGTSGHAIEECDLKRAGDRELAREAERRRKRDAVTASPVEPEQPAKRKRGRPRKAAPAAVKAERKKKRG